MGKQQVVVKFLPKYIRRYKNVKGISRCTLSSDGSLSLILDIGNIINDKWLIQKIYCDRLTNTAKNVQAGLQNLIDTRAKNGGLEYEEIISISRNTRLTMIIS
ncbi:hypothetical protein [Tepidimicrobium xylanilyticum]|uniref:hypothetical protein n=1 Tax=Tepidimicrobium xylanilyticum TaxID=1123352 RepID=UPI00190EDD4A|nr:hypothetical protein [Tepidimicrobium xylanilyticum]